MKTSVQPVESMAIPGIAESITLVSGLPRSGTSMMMRMLSAGGMDITTDNIRKANEDNPNGYYELEKIKQIDGNADWLKKEKGRLIKAISALLPSLPHDLFYYVVFMRRDMKEILKSQKKMLKRRGVADDTIPDDVMAAKYEAYLAATYKWLEKQPHFHVLYVHYNDILDDPFNHAERINDFLGKGLDVREMVRVVDPELYRQRNLA